MQTSIAPIQAQDTVVAIATPPGTGGIAVVRLSGPAAHLLADKIFIPKNSNKCLEKSKGYTALFGEFTYKGKIIDEGIALCFRAPHSYTGENVAELSCHGGSAVSEELLQACLAAGAAPAPPGEFTKRALLNGRISLTQAEAVMELISATSRQGVAVAKAGLSGTLQRQIDEIKQQLITLAGHLAASIDYPEEDVEELPKELFLETLQGGKSTLDHLIREYDRGALVRQGVHAAIVGSPNVGKSTLFNLLSGFDRAIVTPVAGTTRDVVRQEIRVAGIPLLLSDTAGLHDTADVIEAEGIRRSYDEMEQVDIVFAVFDGSLPLTDREQELACRCAGRPALGIVNKSDLGTVLLPEQLQPYFTRLVVVSATDGHARETIEQAFLSILQLDTIDPDAASLANKRQFSAAVAARDAIQEAQTALAGGIGFDVAGVYLQDALTALATLTGENASDTVIEDVFSRFCVGK